MFKLLVEGNTFEHKENLKKDKFRWDPAKSNWSKTSEDAELMKALAREYSEQGLQTTLTAFGNDRNERKYFVKESWIFNLESMHDKLWVLENDIDEGRLQFPFTIANKEIKNWDDFESLRNECYEMEHIAKSRKVTSREYGRIRSIVAWRVETRYAVCMAAGMSESEAGKCFEDM